MPELPEVETIVRDLRPVLEGRRLTRPRLFKTDILRDTTPRRFLSGIRDRRIESVYRRAKNIVILLETGHRLVIQPRMTGSLMIYDRDLLPEERRHAVFEALAGPRWRLVYRDVRRLGTFHLLDEGAWSSYTERIGPEPLERGFTVARFRERLVGTRQAIKKALMDQTRLAGVGNIYANEALFVAGIAPSRRADRLRADEATRLHRAIRDILNRAVAARGTTFRDYRTGTGGRGGFQHTLRVYGRAGLPCTGCGAPLTGTHAIDGRQTVYCRHCQGTR